MQHTHKSILTATVLSLILSGPLANAKQKSDFGQNTVNMNLTAEEVESAQKAWGQALIKISKDYDDAGLQKAKKTAESIIAKAYGYDLGTVLFKPTLTSGEQTYRTTSKGALAYFVGGDKDYPLDSGFALKGWREFYFKNAGVVINGNTAITMGDVILVNKKGETTKVNKTWAFKKDSSGQIKIILHHSSLPYEPQAAKVSSLQN